MEKTVNLGRMYRRVKRRAKRAEWKERLKAALPGIFWRLPNAETRRRIQDLYVRQNDDFAELEDRICGVEMRIRDLEANMETVLRALGLCDAEDIYDPNWEEEGWE